jgi:ribonuclease J
MSDKIKIIALGGLDEEGKNCFAIDISGDIFVIECGVMDPDKTMPGVDYVIPQYEYLIENKSRIKAYLLTHGHDDVMGALAYIYPDAPAPVYGTNVTLALLKMFTRHVRRDPDMYKLVAVAPSSTVKIAGREITFFQTAHNVASSCGIAIHTDIGNIVFTSDFVIENSADPAYLNDMNAIARIAEHPTLALLSESVYAERPGYTAPLYKLTPHIEQVFKLAEGRIFVSLYSNDLYNIDEVARLVVEHKRKLICYDEATLNMVREFQLSGQLNIPKANVANMDDILRVRDQDVVVLMTGFGSKLFRKIALLATAQNEDRRFTLKESDHFIVANMPDDNTEIEYTDAADSLYRS